ncbi:unnamed protein product, partial [Ascophyllum nodosum]
SESPWTANRQFLFFINSHCLLLCTLRTANFPTKRFDEINAPADDRKAFGCVQIFIQQRLLPVLLYDSQCLFAPSASNDVFMLFKEVVNYLLHICLFASHGRCSRLPIPPIAKLTSC